MKDRFAKLVALTRGAAVVGLGMGAGAGCTNEPSGTPPAVSAPTVAENAPVDPASDGGTVGPRRRRFPIPNAMRPRYGGADGSDGGNAPGDGGGNAPDGS
jgi:hypothetical protein